MRTLYLFRHAKASEGQGAGGDHGRPLTEVGVAAARAVGEELRARSVDLGHVVCSTARRALQTYENVARAFPGMSAVLDQRVYEANLRQLLALVQGLDDAYATVTIFGHNPAHAELAQSLAGAGAGKLLAELAHKFPPGAVAGLQFDVGHWAEVAPGEGTLTLFVTPKEIVASK